jgi:hypothetical protein
LDGLVEKMARPHRRAGHVAQWTDLGYRDTAFLDTLMVGVAQVPRAQLPMLDFLKLKMAEAYRHLAAEQPEQCVPAEQLMQGR